MGITAQTSLSARVKKTGYGLAEIRVRAPISPPLAHGRHRFPGAAANHTSSVRAELKNALETVEACIQQNWERERHETHRLPPLVQLLDFATEPQRALAAEELAERFLAHREKARLRDRRYRERKALPAPERAPLPA